MSKFIRIRNIKGIVELTYNLPASSGVYLLTGANGTGKTTLLSALNRMGDNQAFAQNFSEEQTIPGPHSIEYTIGEKSVTYQRKNQRWTPSPRSQSKFIEGYKYHKTYFLTATGLRLYQQSNINLEGQRYNVSEGMISSLNTIFRTERFSQLKYIKVRDIRGRQRVLHRNNKLYILKDSSGKWYSELSFSLGERMVLNALDYISDIPSQSMLLIDEIELALHPIAQILFYNYLEEKAQEKDIVIIISTHSATLIKRAKKIQYLEKNDEGYITMRDNIRSAYVLKDLSIESDNNPDYLFFVEDGMAKEYLTKVLECLREREEILNSICIEVIPVGGYKEVLTLMIYFYGVSPFSEKKVHSFLDKDVEERFKDLSEKTNRSDGENREYKLFDENKSNYNFLSITPELGFWDEIINNIKWFKGIFKSKYPDTLFDIGTFINKANNEENAQNPRKRAKNCLNNLRDKIRSQIPDFEEKDLRRLIIDAYVKRKFREQQFVNMIKSKIMPILHRQ